LHGLLIFEVALLVDLLKLGVEALELAIVLIVRHVFSNFKLFLDIINSRNVIFELFKIK